MVGETGRPLLGQPHPLLGSRHTQRRRHEVSSSGGGSPRNGRGVFNIPARSGLTAHRLFAQRSWCIAEPRRRVRLRGHAAAQPVSTQLAFAWPVGQFGRSTRGDEEPGGRQTSTARQGPVGRRLGSRGSVAGTTDLATCRMAVLGTGIGWRRVDVRHQPADRPMRQHGLPRVPRARNPRHVKERAYRNPRERNRRVPVPL